MTDDDLLAELRAAFPPMPIDASTAFAQRGTLYPDVAELTAALDDKTWDAIDGETLSRRSDALHFLGDEHIRAILPRALYLLVTLGPMSAIGDMLPNFLKRPEAWTAGLDDAQRRMVARAVAEFGARNPNYADIADDVLDRYWRRWLA